MWLKCLTLLFELSIEIKYSTHELEKVAFIHLYMVQTNRRTRTSISADFQVKTTDLFEHKKKLDGEAKLP